MKHKPKSWLNKEIKNAWKQKTNARKSFNNHRTIESLIELKKTSAKLKLEIYKSKRKYIENTIKTINEDTSNKELSEIVKKINCKEENTNEENIIHSNEENAKKLLDINFEKNKGLKLEAVNIPEFINEETVIEVEDWDNIISKKKKKSAPGDDKITYEMLKHLNTKEKNNFIREINEMWQRGKKKLKKTI